MRLGASGGVYAGWFELTSGEYSRRLFAPQGFDGIQPSNRGRFSPFSTVSGGYACAATVRGEVKSGPSAGGAGGPQAAAMRLNDGTTDGQPHTSPVILGRKECREDP